MHHLDITRMPHWNTLQDNLIRSHQGIKRLCDHSRSLVEYGSPLSESDTAVDTLINRLVSVWIFILSWSYIRNIYYFKFLTMLLNRLFIICPYLCFLKNSYDQKELAFKSAIISIVRYEKKSKWKLLNLFAHVTVNIHAGRNKPTVRISLNFGPNTNEIVQRGILTKCSKK